MKNWLWCITGALEEIRKLRVKVEYQQRWIDWRSRADGVKDCRAAVESLRVMQRRATRLMQEQPDIYRDYFSKEAPK